ncbi:MAG: autotransporter-associated beta strand repeat-containing protein [Kiritimatiellaeota bacterium]|nr:autotransporter-associated beta strand repeat-containing protein [Kiritimatiellota bacterium]
MKKYVMSCVMVALSLNALAIEVKGSLLVDLAATNVAEVVNGKVQKWPNEGSQGGSFTNVVANEGPLLTTFGAANTPALYFSGDANGARNSNSILAGMTPDAAITGGNSWTVEAWIAVPAVSTASSTFFSWTYRGSSVDARLFEARYSNDGNAIEHYGSGHNVSWGTRPPAGSWHHVVLTRDGSTQMEYVYVNGMQTTAASRTSINLLADGIFLVGTTQNGNRNGWDYQATAYIGQIRVHTGFMRLLEAQVNFAQEHAAYGVVPQLAIWDNPSVSPPQPWESPSNWLVGVKPSASLPGIIANGGSAVLSTPLGLIRSLKVAEGSLTLEGGASLEMWAASPGAPLYVSDAAGTTGTLNVVEGFLAMRDPGVATQLYLGNTTNSLGTMNIGGGALPARVEINRDIRVGSNLGATGRLTIWDNGTLTRWGNEGGYIRMGQDRGDGKLTVNGGTVFYPRIQLVSNGGTGVLEMNGGFVRLTDSVYFSADTGYADAQAIVYLNGGVLQLPRFNIDKENGVNEIYFNGGTVRSVNNQSDFINKDSTRLYVQAGGAVFDIIDNTDVAIQRALRHDPALGVTVDGGIVKRGTGLLRLTGGPHTFTGDIILEDGLLFFGRDDLMPGYAGKVRFANPDAVVGCNFAGGVPWLLSIIPTDAVGYLAIFQENKDDIIDLSTHPYLKLATRGEFTLSKPVITAPGVPLSLCPLNGATLTYNHPITGTTALLVAGQGSGTLILDNTGANNYTGGTTITGGKIRLENLGQLGSGMITLADDGALHLNANNFNPSAALLARITTGSRGYILINGNTTGTSFDFATSGHPGLYLGAIENDRTYNATLTPHGDTYRAGGGWMGFRNNGNPGLSLQNLTDNGGSPRHLAIEGEGAVRIRNASAFTGNIAVTNRGGLMIGNDAQNLAASSSLYVNNGTVKLRDGVTVPSRVTLTVGAEGMEVNTAGSTYPSFAGALAGTGRIFTTDSGHTFFADASGFAGVFDPCNSGSTLGVGAGMTFAWNPAIVLTNSAVNVTGYFGLGYEDDLLWSADLVRPMGVDSHGYGLGLRKRGAGTLTVDVAQDYTGDTLIEQGTLKVAHDDALPKGIGRGKVGVADGAVLDVNGRDITVNGIINPGLVTDGLGGAQTVTVGADASSWTLMATIDPALTLVKTGSGTMTVDPTAQVRDVAVAAGTAALTMPGGITGDFTLTGGGTLTVNGIQPPAAIGEPQGLTAYYYQMTNADRLNANLMPTLGALNAFFYSTTPMLVTNTTHAGETLNFGLSTSTEPCLFPVPFDANGADNFIAIYRGAFTAEESGDYIFGTQWSDDFVVVFIDGVLAVTATTSGNIVQGAPIHLEAGEHDIAIGFYERGGNQGFAVWMQAPSDAAISELPQALLSPAFTLEGAARVGGLSGPASTRLNLNGSAIANVGTADGSTATFSGTVNATTNSVLRKVGPGLQVIASAQPLTLGYIDASEGTLQIATPGNAAAFLASYLNTSNPDNNYQGVILSSLTGGAPGGVLLLDAGCNLKMNRATEDTAFAGSIEGPAQTVIVKNDQQVLTLTGDNDGFLGTWVIHNGVLDVGAGGTLGSGAVVNNAELRFSGDEDYAATLQGGNGTVVKRGDGTLYVSSVNNAPLSQSFTVEGGRVVFDTQGGTLFLRGTMDVAEGASWGFTGGGKVIILDSDELPPSHIIIDDAEWSIQGNKNNTPPILDGLTVALDASNFSTLTIGAGGVVSQWDSTIGGTMSHTNPAAATSPFYLPDAFDGKGGVVFGTNLLTDTYAPTWLSSTDETVMKTVFIVNRLNAQQRAYSGIFGQSNADKGIRYQENSTKLRMPGSGDDFVNNNGKVYTNGVDISSLVDPDVGTAPFLLTQLAGNANNSWNASIYTTVGNYWWSNSGTRNYRGEIGELLVYNRALADGERETVEAYLMNKWLTPGLVQTDTMLPEGLAIELGNGGVLNLNGTSQTVATVIAGEGGGSVINGTLTVTDTLIITLLPDGSTAGLVAFDNLVLGPNARLIVNGMEYAKGVIDVFTATTVSPATPFAKENLPKAWSGNFRNNLYRISHGATLIILR